MKKNDIITLNIEDLNSDGAGVGRYDGLVVFVPYALPGETVETLIIKVTKNYAVGKIQKIIKKANERIEPKCPYFYRCGGCDYQHINYNDQLQLKCSSTIKNIHKISQNKDIKIKKIIGADELWNYRNKAQFPVSKDKENNVIMGFFSSKSHRVVSIDKCILQDNKCNSIIEPIKKIIKKHNISIYDEINHKGILRHIIARASKNELMVILVTNCNEKLPDNFINDIKITLPFITTLIQNINTKKGNIILGSKCITLFGKGYINDILCGINFRLRPLAFLQVNANQAEKLYNTALEYANLTGNEIVFDAYCGIGVMSLMLAKKAKKLIGVEIVPEAIETAKESAKLNGINNTEFIVGACEDVLPQLLKKGENPDVIVVDPPRAGCEASLINAIAENNIKKIVYVSCNPATLARDIKLFNELGYSCSDVTFVDMFCHTKHIESVICLTK
ncbi:MAG: 23S rRNA (uracil(1939)-C(5))-methyltransferase RlmD [Clostridiales bacterium]|nr:23S rRNA (uracil(1939)-C(5))-methyltransferase RlmD [Clostridiales bacterium]